jgi:hypothetical protein
VNWKLLELIQEKLKVNNCPPLLNIGSCGLHTVHNAFKHGCKKSGFEVCSFLKAHHFLFFETSARREDFSEITGSSVFPLPFCGHRWLENIPVV